MTFPIDSLLHETRRPHREYIAPPLAEADLFEPFYAGRKDPADFRIGVELEHFPVQPKSLRVAPYRRRQGIRSILRELIKRHRWVPIFEGPHIIGLRRGLEQISLEPGGAIEYSSPPVRLIDDLKRLYAGFLREIHPALKRRSLKLLLMGFHPLEDADTVELVPKSRYHIMYPYMMKTGSTGDQMMKLTASTQVSIDYESESDAMRKLVLASKATPLFIALAANSSFARGRFRNVACQRARTWCGTDVFRTGLPEFVFQRRPEFQDYVEWALDVPMYFIERGGHKLPMTSYSFRQFFRGEAVGVEARHCTREDWILHLSTLFPWVRLRSYVEIRSFDMNGGDMPIAAAALIKGLFYCRRSLDRLEDFLDRYDRKDFSLLFEAAIRDGLDGRAGRLSVREEVSLLLDIAADGLAELGEGEAAYLLPFWERLWTWSLAGIEREFSSGGMQYLRSHLL